MILISDDYEKIIRDPKVVSVDLYLDRETIVIKVDGYIFGYYKSRKTALAEMKNISDMMATNKAYQVHSSEE